MKRPVIALVIAGLLLATAGSTALAKTTRIEVAGTASPTAAPVPGTMITHGNIVVMRGFKDFAEVEPGHDRPVRGRPPGGCRQLDWRSQDEPRRALGHGRPLAGRLSRRHLAVHLRRHVRGLRPWSVDRRGSARGRYARRPGRQAESRQDGGTAMHGHPPSRSGSTRRTGAVNAASGLPPGMRQPSHS